LRARSIKPTASHKLFTDFYFEWISSVLTVAGVAPLGIQVVVFVLLLFLVAVDVGVFSRRACAIPGHLFVKIAVVFVAILARNCSPGPNLSPVHFLLRVTSCFHNFEPLHVANVLFVGYLASLPLTQPIL